MTFEHKLAVWMLAAIALFLAVIAIIWWQDSLMEDGAWFWICEWMGNRACNPGEPWFDWRGPGGID